MKQLAFIAAVLAVTPSVAHAFCGFYVSGSGGKLFNDATQVVMMREGTRTVLSMQNDYKGPLEDFAMVVPVPVVLKKENVKTLPQSVFEHVESLGAPRLVEYWEQDPCPKPVEASEGVGFGYGRASAAYGGMALSEGSMGKPSVKIEAKFDVAEYEILVLSATDSAGLETWLKDNKYKIPDGAEPLLRPYVEAGSKFFVAKVDPKKVHMEGGHAALSPLRFHYDSEDFSLPIRLGMANSSGTQDLIVNIISPDKRYEVANYKNVFIPTNFDVKPAVKNRFAEFYAALFDKTIEANPHAVVTEYAWTAQQSYHCDPCPELDVNNQDLALLGGDVIKAPLATKFVMTRMHARYSAKDMKDDLRFKEAKAVVGGREQYSKQGIEYGAKPAQESFFQARYAIRHWWSGPIQCEHPQRGVWGGPPDGSDQVIGASKLAFVPRGKLQLGTLIGRDLWEIGFKKTKLPPPPPKPKTPTKQGGAAKPVKILGGTLFGALLVASIVWRRRRR